MKLDLALNMIKTKVFEAQKIVLDYIFKLEEDKQNNSPHIPKAIAYIPFVTNSLLVFVQDKNYEAYLEDETYENLVVAMIDIVIIVCSESKFKDIMLNNMKTMAVEIALNLMVITRAEAETIREDAEEYVNLTLDCCDKQTSMTIKS